MFAYITEHNTLLAITIDNIQSMRYHKVNMTFTWLKSRGNGNGLTFRRVFDINYN